jgi:multidrug efflux pump subunit AcrB
MNLSATFIRRPTATALLMVAILLLGLISYELLPVAALPNIDTPTVLVTAQFPGADAQTVASTVTTPLERQFGQIPGLTQLTSSSGNESSEITLQFDRSMSVDFASQAVQERCERRWPRSTSRKAHCTAKARLSRCKPTIS